MSDKTEIVTAIAASLYASRATNDALRAEQDFDALAGEAWELYGKLDQAVRAAGPAEDRTAETRLVGVVDRRQP
jgi:hypothetical protein